MNRVGGWGTRLSNSTSSRVRFRIKLFSVPMIASASSLGQHANDGVDIQQSHCRQAPLSLQFARFTICIETPKEESLLKRVRVVDSHTGGEPTRTVIEG